MRIVEARVLEYTRKLDGRSWNPVSRWTERRAPLLLLRADNGATGCGEAWSRQEDIGLAFAALRRHLARDVVGRTFADEAAIRALVAGADEHWADASARSAADIALWDTLARSRNVALWTLVDGRGGRVRVYASGGLYRDGAALPELRSEVGAYRAQGFLDVKIKVGALALARDIERVAASREAMAGAGALWIDAVNQLQPGEALGSARALRDAGAQAIQAPVAFDDHASMARIDREVMPVIAGEAEFAAAAFERLLATRSASLLQLNLGLCGGISGATRIAAMAAGRAAGVTVQAHGTAVLKAASLQWGASGVHSVEYHRFHEHLDALLDPALRSIEHGVVALGEAPGLGITLPQSGPQPDGGEIRTVFTLHQDDSRR